MSDHADAELAIEDVEDVEVVDAVPVVAQVREVQETRSALPVVAQAAAVATTAFAAGAVTAAMVRHHRVKKAVKRRRKDTARLGDVVASRSFLVDVHLLGSRD